MICSGMCCLYTCIFVPYSFRQGTFIASWLSVVMYNCRAACRDVSAICTCISRYTYRLCACISRMSDIHIAIYRGSPVSISRESLTNDKHTEVDKANNLSDTDNKNNNNMCMYDRIC